VDVFGWGSLGEDVVDVLGELAGVGAEDHELELILAVGFGEGGGYEWTLVIRL